MEITCPSCWAHYKIEPWMLSVVCKYCNTIIKIERNEVVATWEKSIILPFPTTFEVGKYFYAVKDKTSNDKLFWENVAYLSDEEFYKKNLKDFLIKIYVYGQIRYTNDGGFWDDWFVRIVKTTKNIDTNKEFVIKENEWIISMQYITDIKEKNYSDVLDKSVWTSYNWYFIQEKWIAKIEWFKWDFPFYIDSNKNSKYSILVWENEIIEYKTIWENLIISKSI